MTTCTLTRNPVPLGWGDHVRWQHDLPDAMTVGGRWAQALRRQEVGRMTVDGSRLRVAAVGNHRAGYHGYLEIVGLPGGPWQWTCEHQHVTTAQARGCARQAVRTALDRPRSRRRWASARTADGLAVATLSAAEAEALTAPDARPVAQGDGPDDAEADPGWPPQDS